MAKSVYEMVTDRIINQLEQGVIEIKRRLASENEFSSFQAAC